jgi:glutaminyl-peptide cyclotransferase
VLRSHVGERTRKDARVRSFAAVALGAAALAGVAAVGCGGGSADGAGGAVAKPARADRFNGAAAMRLVRLQVGYGPRPAGSKASRRLAERLRAELPDGRFQSVPHGLRNVIGVVPGRDPKRTVIVGAHYDTKDIPGFVGAIDSGSGTAVAVQLARTLRPRQVRPTVVFALFDGEESPRGTPDTTEDFRRRGLRGSKVAAKKLPRAEAMILVDFVGNRTLRLAREDLSDFKLWERLRSAARRVGAGGAFPDTTQPEVSDDHVPFLKRGIPAVNLIDFDFPCWHKTCDDLSKVSTRSLDQTGESVLQLLLSS